MIRIKVYKASHLIIGALIAVLVVVLAVIVIRFALNDSGVPAGAIRGDGQRTATEGVAAYAAAPSSYDKVKEVVFDPPKEGPIEDEHTDERDDTFFIEVVPPTEASGEKRPAEEIRVLIYHTHTHEAYRQVEADPYEETERWRTLDQTHSIVAVGAALAQQLRDMGISVVHDSTDHEAPALNTAYNRSLNTLENYGAGIFDLYIDVHRDAYGESTHHGVVSVFAGEQKAAQLMVLLGNGDGFEEKPDFAGNYRFAVALTERINGRTPDLCRDVLVKKGRYNQHIGERAILVEVGHNLNTLEEALNAVPALAEGLYETLMMSGE